MKIFIASDHAGFSLKEQLKLKFDNIEFLDFGTNNEESCDYPVFAKKAIKEFKKNKDDNFLVLICGTGIGMSIVANREKDIFASLVYDPEIAKTTRQHNNSNCLCLGARVVDDGINFAVFENFINTKFSNEERHQKRILMV